MPNRLIEHQLQALREAFMALLPYVLFMMLGTLTLAFTHPFSWGAWWGLDWIRGTVQLLHQLLPFVISISIILHSANIFGLNQAMATIANIIVLVSAQYILCQISSSQFLFTELSPLLAVFAPIVLLHTLMWTTANKRIERNYMSLSAEATEVFLLLKPMLVACLISILLLLVGSNLVMEAVQFIKLYVDAPSALGALWIKTLVSHLFWGVGIHGGHMQAMLIGAPLDTMIDGTQINSKNFYDLFVIFGGSGACLSLVLAVFLQNQHHPSRKIAKVATPFVIFNISELIIYGLPIVFNRTLLLPFILVPLVNVGLASTVIPYLNISIINDQVPWVTPVFINAYLATDGNWLVVALQAALLGLGTAIYCPFVKAYDHHQQASSVIRALHQKLDVVHHIQNHNRFQFWRDNDRFSASRAEIYRSLDLILQNDLQLHFQPIYNMKTASFTKFECLLRVATATQFLPPQEVLKALERAGINSSIDWWVALQVRQLLDTSDQPNISISINIHPSTLATDFTISSLCELLQGLPITIEVLEHHTKNKQLLTSNLQRLKDAGISIALDDFGVGYCNLAALHLRPADYLKLDRSLLLAASDSDAGNIIFKNACSLGRQLGLQVIVEGVETQAHFNLCKQAQVDYCQGWYFSPALPWDEAIVFAKQSHNLHQQ